MSTHLAIFTQPFLDLLLDGQKTIESRFAKVRCAPHGCIRKGDRVLCKVSGGPIIGEFTAGKVLSFTNMFDATLDEIAKHYSTQICSDVDPNFWEARKGKKYATLIFVESPRRLATPQPFHKRDKRGWVVLNVATQTYSLVGGNQ